MNDSSVTPASLVRCHALLPCAGTGSRAGTAGPKQYQMVAGLPMVLHTLTAFNEVSRITQTLLVVAPEDRFLTVDYPELRLAQCGGATRAHSVFNGLEALKTRGAADNDWVLVHDAARCLITPAQIDVLIDACWNDPVGGLLALKLPDTLKTESEGRVSATVDRSDKWLAQTPQMFRCLACHMQRLHSLCTCARARAGQLSSLAVFRPRLSLHRHLLHVSLDMTDVLLGHDKSRALAVEAR